MVDESTLAAQAAEATLTGLALGSTIAIMARKYVVLAREMVPVKPRSKVTQVAVYLRAHDGSLHTLLRDGTGLVIVSGRKRTPARGLKIAP